MTQEQRYIQAMASIKLAMQEDADASGKARADGDLLMLARFLDDDGVIQGGYVLTRHNHWNGNTDNVQSFDHNVVVQEAAKRKARHIILTAPWLHTNEPANEKLSIESIARWFAVAILLRDHLREAHGINVLAMQNVDSTGKNVTPNVWTVDEAAKILAGMTSKGQYTMDELLEGGPHEAN